METRHIVTKSMTVLPNLSDSRQFTDTAEATSGIIVKSDSGIAEKDSPAAMLNVIDELAADENPDDTVDNPLISQ